MRTLTPSLLTLACLALAGGLPSQQARDEATAGTVPELDYLTGAPTLQSEESGTWVGGAHGYLARFDAQGLRFLPALGEHAPRELPATFSTKEIVRGGRSMLAAHPAVEATGLQVRYRHPFGTERYDLRADGVALSFVFPEPIPGRGDLRVRMSVGTELAPVASDLPGVTLHGLGDDGLDCGGVHIGGVTGIDADGRRSPGAVHYEDGVLELSLPGAFLEDAAWPVVLDPLIRTDLTYRPGNFAPGVNADIAFEPTSSRYCVVWEERYASRSADVRGRIFDINGRAIGGEILFTTSSSFQEMDPAVGSVRLRGRFGVVWVDDQNISTGWDIWGRSFDPVSFQLGPITRLQNAAGTERRPDVSSDATATDDEFLLVWENSSTALVGARQVTISSTGSLVPFGARTIQSGSPRVGFPRIAKSGGATARHLIVWIEEQSGHTDVRGRVFDRNLNPIGNAIDIANTSRDEDLPDVDGNGREWVVAYESEVSPGSGDNDIRARALYLDNTVLIRGTERSVEAQANDDELNATVAWLGESALVAYIDRRSPTGPYDAYLWSIDPYSCTSCEGKFTLQALGSVDVRQPMIAGSYGLSGDIRGNSALIGWRTTTAATSVLAGALFSMEDGLITNLGLGCSNGGRAFASCARTGFSDFRMQIRETSGLDTVYAILSLDRLGGGSCGGCTLIADPFRGWVFPVRTDLFGNGSLSLPIPDQAALEGTRLVNQWLTPGAAGCTALGGALSNALEIRIQR